MCEAFLHHGHGLSHGRRAVGIGNDAHVAQLCGGCCDSDACNRGGCYTIRESAGLESFSVVIILIENINSLRSCISLVFEHVYRLYYDSSSWFKEINIP